MSAYAAEQLIAQSQRGPYPGEDFYRLKVSGNGETNSVNITQEQLEEIVLVLEGNWTALATRAAELARSERMPERRATITTGTEWPRA